MKNGISLLLFGWSAADGLSRIMCFWIYCLSINDTYFLVGVVALFILPSLPGEDRILGWKTLPSEFLGNFDSFLAGTGFGRRISKLQD